MKEVRMSKSIFLAAILAASMSSAAFAYEDFIVNTDSVGHSTHGVVTSDQFLELGQPSSNALRMEGEQSMRMGHLDRAIMVLQRSLELSPMDVDTRIAYGEALEKKLMTQRDKDPALFNFLIKQWLYIAKKAEFPDQQVIGRAHLYNMAGDAPKPWESSKKFLNRVLIMEDGTAKVALGGGGANTKAKKPKKKKDDEDM
jgi:hypothetical protein